MFRIIQRGFYWLCNNPKLFVITVLDYMAPLFPDQLFIKLHFAMSMGYSLDLRTPKTFCEKIQWLKFNDIHDEYSIMVDKAEVKNYVASIIGEEYIIPTFAVWNSVDEIDWNSLPNKFVIKPTNDSGGLVICKDKSKLDIEGAKNRLREFGKRDYSIISKEYPYKNVPHRFIAEEYKEDESGELRDYKFFCFNGRAEYCQIIQGRSTEMTIDFYDRDWQHMPFHEPKKFPFSAHENSRPKNYEKMLEIASKLASGIPFIRVDLYNIDGRIYFGELTFFPTSGFGGFDPIEWDRKLGDMLVLPTT